ncbi:MAG: PLP-dependent aminotransferase family protein [Thermovirgaceae bacterium]|nr:PLP-dependent aminotransferase family protein [Thermovirgaceae bacterium]
MSKIWESNFSNKAKNVRPSPIREILSVIRQPGMISFAGGMPAPEVFPVKEFHKGVDALLNDGPNLLQYGTTEGYPPLKEFLSGWTAPRMGRKVSLDEMLLTTGSQQGLDLMGWAMIDPGDYIITEDPSYLAAITAFHNHGSRFISIPVDARGMVVEIIPEAIEKARAEGKNIKFIYTIVNFQNPAGSTMTLERRKKLVEISHKYNIPILEDDPYGYVRYDGEHLPSIFSLDPDGGVIYAGTFSKILAPGTRIGWCSGNKDIIRKLTVFKQATDLCSSPITQALVYEYCKMGYLDSHLPNIIANYREKRDAMDASFRKHLPLDEVSWVKPEGGFFFWLDMPNIDAKTLFDKAIEKKVAFVIGAPFFANGGGEHNARMNFTFSSPEVIDEGVKRLGEAMREMLK